MNLRSLTNEELKTKMTKLVQTERKITHLILECINEIEMRKIHLKEGYSSLFDYLTKALGYTGGSAQRRIDGARLMRQIPTIAEDIEQGKINLMQISMLVKTTRELEKTQNKKVGPELKLEAISKIKSLNTQDTELVLAQTFQIPVPTPAIQVKRHQDESQTVSLHFTKAEIEIIEQVKKQLSHKIKSHSLKDAILYLADREIKKTQNKMIQGHSKCVYVDSASGKTCGSDTFLEKDHIHPRWDGGSDDEKNIQILCSAHNKLRYQQQAFLI